MMIEKYIKYLQTIYPSAIRWRNDCSSTYGIVVMITEPDRRRTREMFRTCRRIGKYFNVNVRRLELYGLCGGLIDYVYNIGLIGGDEFVASKPREIEINVFQI